MQPNFPIYVVSKGRADSRLTMKYFERFKTKYYLIVEEQERVQYAAVTDPRYGTILTLDPLYQRDYDIFEDIGTKGRTGSGPARNFAWDHAQNLGAPWHWTVDDNIRQLYRANDGGKIPSDTTGMRVMEDFVLRYENVGMAGPQYYTFVPRKYFFRPFVLNTRIYSFNFIRTALPFRWRGRYNEDTDLSLRILKAGWCTIEFYAFLQEKTATMTMKGGNTDSIYTGGTVAKSLMIHHMHPDVVKLKWRYGRPHHMIDYSGFKQPLIKKRVQPETPDYGLRMIPQPLKLKKRVAPVRERPASG